MSRKGGAVKSKILYYLEDYGPILLMGVVIIISTYVDCKYIVDINSLNNLITAIITATSIIVGFIGVLAGIIATIRDQSNFQVFLDIDNGAPRKRLERYFIKVILSSLIVISLSFLLYFKNIISEISGVLFHLIGIIWLGLAAYMGASSLRIILFIIQVLFSDRSNNTVNRVIGPRLDDLKKKELFKGRSKEIK